MSSYIVYGLPRSRTYWLSRYLTYGDWLCGHDELRYARSMDDVRSWLSQPCTGTVETAAAPFWRIAKHIKTVVIRRPVEQVVDSFCKFGFQFDRAIFTQQIHRFDRKLDQIEQRVPNVLSVTFDDLVQEETCKRVFEFCLPYPHDHAWWEAMSALNLQMNVYHMMRYYKAYEPQLNRLCKIAKHITIGEMNRTHIEVDKDDGLTIQEESIATFEPDAKKLFAEHCVLIGQTPDQWESYNIPLMRLIEKIDGLQITTARCNGRLFGYLMTLINPSLETRDHLTAVPTMFYASPEFKGLGMKLQRAAVASLREKGVGEVFFRAGVRGDGPRTSVLYRRMGAVPDGEWFKLDLNP